MAADNKLQLNSMCVTQKKKKVQKEEPRMNLFACGC